METIRRSVNPASPGSEPVSKTEAKKHLEIATGDTAHDDHVDDLIQAGREVFEYDTQSLLVSRTVVENLDFFPDECWRFYYRPVSSITSIKYYDANNEQQTLSSAIYTLDAPNRRILLAVDQDWPEIESRWDAVEVTYVAGYSSVPEDAKQAIKLWIDAHFELRGMTKEKDAVLRAYENLVQRFRRACYP
jgi:uncharacterized phiE125 gp8 family phage protein